MNKDARQLRRERLSPKRTIIRDKLEQRLKRQPEWEGPPGRGGKARARAWLVALGVGLLVGGLLAVLSETSPGLIGLIAVCAVVGIGVVGGRLRWEAGGAEE